MAVNYEKLREAAVRTVSSTPSGEWKLQTSNSYRRIGTHYGDGDVLCAVTQWRDGHPDLHAAPGVLDYIVAAQPRVVLELLDEIDRLRASEESWEKEAERHERDHRTHYEERETLRAALTEVLAIAEAHAAVSYLSLGKRDYDRIVELRRRHEDGALPEVKR